MSVLNRPLFRQAGGPAQPMPQDMAPMLPIGPPPQSQVGPPPQPQMDPEMARQAGVLEKVEMEARASGEQMGAEYAQNMMAGIDGAQSTEDLINALRGNNRPLDSRREELAGYVGQGDADQTPESVLAMVQPVIMMTEEGAMDSGIGALVQQIAGDVEMTTADGTPTDMGMGVGSLMTAGAQEAPAPQNFRQGGAVQRFNDGGAALTFDARNVQTQYESLMPLFQEINSQAERDAEAEERGEMDKAQALLSLARGGLRLAAGDPKSGGSFASQIGSAFEPTAAEIAALGAQAQERRSGIRAEDRALRSAALQGAIGIEQSAVSDRQATAVAKIAADARRATGKADERIVLDSSGNEVAVVDLSTSTGTTSYNDYQSRNAKAVEAGETPPFKFRKMGTGTTAMQNYTIQSMNPDTNTFTTVLVESFDGGRTYINDEGAAIPFPIGRGTNIAEVSPEVATQVQRSIGTASRYQRILENHLAGENTAGMEEITNNSINAALISDFAANPEKMLGTDGKIIESDVSKIPELLNEARSFAYDAALNGTGPVNMLRSGLQAGFGFLQEGMDADDALREQQRTLLRAIRFVGKTALISNSRMPVAESVLSAELFPDPDKLFVDPDVEAQKFQVIAQMTDALYTHNLRELASGNLDATQRAEAESSLRKVSFLRSLLGYVPEFTEEMLNDSNRFTGYEERMNKKGNTGIQ